tara:strand:+ start:425 stop:1258 length:834 start_codon:yes stop_codon:yes gene_type:complete
MIIWLASYPKSGNTLVRSLLSAYFFSKEGDYNFDLIKNIQQFPDINLFKKFGVNINNENEIIKNYISIQDKINKKNSIQFYKTHSSLFKIKDNAFTDLRNSLGVIYIVRDPRNVVTSWAHHNNLSINDSCDYLIYQKETSGNPNKVYHGTWNYNFHSWKSFKYEQRYLLIKYEDLILEKKNTFLKILEFINKFNKKKFTINIKKFDNVLNSTSFKNMKKLENEKGFFEAMTDKNSGKKKPFFNLGPENNWKKILDGKVRIKIEKVFKDEMEELGYLN